MNDIALLNIVSLRFQFPNYLKPEGLLHVSLLVFVTTQTLTVRFMEENFKYIISLNIVTMFTKKPF